MGVEPFLVSSALSGVLAQRLVRRICKHCAEPFEPDPVEIPADFKLPEGATVYRGKGCRECRQSGYRGRLGIYELLTINDEIREMILERRSATEILDISRKKFSLKVMREDGWAKALKGMTTIEEVNRVTKVDVSALE